MRHNDTVCQKWRQQNWFSDYCSGSDRDHVPRENFFGEDENGNGFTLKQACNKECKQGKVVLNNKKCFKYSN